MSKTLRIGIIGSGGIAGAHVHNYKKMSNVEVVAVSDVVEGKAEQFIQKFDLKNARAFTDHRKMLELELDGVSICTPNVAHYQTTVDSLNAGKNVLVEKPLSVTLEQGVEMVRTAKKTGKILTVGFQPRYDPNTQIIKDIVQSGQLGKIYYVETGGGRRRGMPGGTFIRKELAGAGAIADIGCYSLDLALNTLGNPKPLTVSAYTSNYFGTNPLYHSEAGRFEVEDFGVALIRLENDIVMNFKISWAMHMDSLGATLFLGTDAGLKVTPLRTGPWGGVFDGPVGEITLYHDIRGHHTESRIPSIVHNTDLFFEKIKAFVDALATNGPAPIPGEEILVNQAIIDAVLRSAELKKEVDVHIPEI